MKEKTKAAALTADLLKRPPGRPATGKALTGAERIKKMRADRKAAGLCPCCGQKMPV